MTVLMVLIAPFSREETQKPLLTLDEFFSVTEIRKVQISPDGGKVAIETVHA